MWGREGGRSGTSPCPAFEVWEVKITGTASRLNRRFHLSGWIKAPAAGTHTPYSPLTSIPSPHPPLFPSAPLNPSTKALGFLFSTIKGENIAELLNYSKNKSSGECRLYHEKKDPVVGRCVHWCYWAGITFLDFPCIALWQGKKVQLDDFRL